MTWWQRLFRRRQMEEQLEKELCFHLDAHTSDLIAQGYSPEEARRLTRDLLEHLFAGIDAGLYRFETDFLQDASGGFGEAYYFEGKGCDNAALLTAGPVGYLLLTNGMP